MNWCEKEYLYRPRYPNDLVGRSKCGFSLQLGLVRTGSSSRIAVMTTYYLYGWFESLALVLLCLALLKTAWKVPQVILSTTMLFFGVMIIRNLHLALGINSVLTIVILALFIAWLFSLPLGKSLVASSMAMMVLVLFEVPIRMGLNKFIDETSDPNLWLLSSIPHVVVLFIIAFVVRRRDIKVFFQ